MKKNLTLQERDDVKNPILYHAQDEEGLWTVYEEGDELPVVVELQEVV